MPHSRVAIQPTAYGAGRSLRLDVRVSYSGTASKTQYYKMVATCCATSDDDDDSHDDDDEHDCDRAFSVGHATPLPTN